MNTAARRSLILVTAADGLSRFGSAMTAVAIPWFVLVTTNSVARTSYTVFAGAVGAVLALFFGGVVVDRLSYARASALADFPAGLVVALIPLLYLTIGLPFFLLLLLVFVAALLDTPAQVARYSAMPDLARDAGVRFERANSIFDAVFTITGLIGPALAGVLISAFEATDVLWIDAATFWLSALLMLAVARWMSITQRSDTTSDSYLAQLRGALRFVYHEHVLFPLLIFFAVMNLAIGPMEALFVPVIARDVYHSAYALGFLSTALAVGALGGNALFGAIGHRLPRRALFGVGYLALPLSFAILAVKPWFGIALVSLGVVGLGLSLANLLEYTIYFERIPAEMRARGLGVAGTISWGSVPLGRLLGGAVLAAFGLTATLGAFALAFAPVPFLLLILPTFRHLEDAATELLEHEEALPGVH
ncbi:MAG TPA: MFS transporter [Nitrolancea sp.]|nr:MFS transporter [Nitrolancea sp.]